MFKALICIFLALMTLNLIEGKKTYLKAKTYNLKIHKGTSCDSGHPFIIETSDGSGNYLGLSQSSESMILAVGNVIFLFIYICYIF